VKAKNTPATGRYAPGISFVLLIIIPLIDRVISIMPIISIISNH